VAQGSRDLVRRGIKVEEGKTLLLCLHRDQGGEQKGCNLKSFERTVRGEGYFWRDKEGRPTGIKKKNGTLEPDCAFRGRVLKQNQRGSWTREDCIERRAVERRLGSRKQKDDIISPKLAEKKRGARVN